MANTASLKKEYAERIAPALMKQFNYSSSMQIPVLKKIVINQGLGMATADKKIIEVSADNPEHLKHIINFLHSMKNISTVEHAVVDPTNRNIITEFINNFGDKGSSENVGFNNNELFAMIAIGKNLTGSDQTTLTRYLKMCNK